MTLGDNMAACWVAVCAVFSFGCAWQYFTLRYRKNWQTYLALALLAVWFTPILLGIVAGVTGAGEDTLSLLMSFSPFAGVGITAGSGDSLDATGIHHACRLIATISQTVLAVVAGALRSRLKFSLLPLSDLFLSV